MIQDKIEQFILQRAVWIKDQWLQSVSTAVDQLVTEDHQQVTQQHEGLWRETRQHYSVHVETFTNVLTKTVHLRDVIKELQQKFNRIVVC